MTLASVIADVEATHRIIGLSLASLRVSFPTDGGSHAAVALSWRASQDAWQRRKAQTTVAMSSWTRPATEIMRIARPGEDEILDVGWRMGAPDISRTQFRPLPAAVDPHDHKWGLVSIYGDMVYESGGRDLVINIADGRTRDMIDVSAAMGWVTYLHKTGCGPFGGLIDSPSIDPDGRRRKMRPRWATPVPLRMLAGEAAGHCQLWTFVRGRGARIITRDAWMDKYMRDCAMDDGGGDGAL